MIAWPLAAQNGCQSSYTWLFGSTCSLFQFRTNQFCSKWLPFSLNCLFDNWLLKMAANPWLLGHWQLKMATYLLILGLLDPHAPCSSPDLISSAQNGCQSRIAWPMVTQNGYLISSAQNGCQSRIAWPMVTQNGYQSTFTWSLGSRCSLVQSRPHLFCSKWLPFYFYFLLRLL